MHLSKTLLLSILRFFLAISLGGQAYSPLYLSLQGAISPVHIRAFLPLAVPLRATGMQRESGGGVGSSGKRILGIIARNKAEIPALRSWEWCVLGQGCDWTAESTGGRKAKVKELGSGEKPFLHPPQCTFTQAQKQGAALAWCVKGDANRCWTQEALYPKSAR